MSEDKEELHNPDNLVIPDLPKNISPQQYMKMQEAGKATRFPPGKPGNDYTKTRPYEIRNGLRRIGALEIDADPARAEKELKNFLHREARLGRCTAATMLAMRMYAKAIAKVDANLCEKIIENAEGKLVQPIQELPPDQPMPEEFATEAEAAAAHAELTK